MKNYYVLRHFLLLGLPSTGLICQLVLLLCLQIGSIRFGYAQNYVWAKRIGGAGSAIGLSVALDGSGNVYTTGGFEGTVDFDPGLGVANLTSAGNFDIFVSKLDALGNFVWVKQIGSTGPDQGSSIKVDALGNVYTTGSFSGTVDFNPGSGTANLTAADVSDIFVSKLDASGNFVWAKAMGGTSNDVGNAIAVDGSGNVYTTGSFAGTADFDPGAGVYSLSSVGSADIFVSKLDASGNFIWAKAMGGSSYDISNSIAVDGLGNVYTTGSFQSTADFDPGSGTANLITPGTFTDNIFVSKLDVSGNFVWAKQMGGSTQDKGKSIAVDGSGNSYTTGSFVGMSDFDPGSGVVNLTSATLGPDIFVSKLDASGNFVWAKAMSGNNLEEGSSIAVDGSGNVYTTGGFQGTVDFDPGSGVANLASGGSVALFVSKLDATGSFVSARCMGGSTSNDVAQGSSIAIDGLGTIYTTGYFSGTVDFDPGSGTANLTSTGTQEIFVSKLSQAQPPQLVTSANPNQVCVGNSVALSVTATGGTSPYSYTWVAPAGAPLSATNTASISATLTLAGVKTFTVTVAGANGASSSQPVNVTVNTLSPDYQPLVDLYNTTGGANWTNRTGWLSGCDPCTGNGGSAWAGVECTSGRVVRLNLDNNHMVGTLPASMSALNQLVNLQVPNNQLTGGIDALRNLANLVDINLYNNQFSGPLPSFTAMTSLQILVAHGGNQFSGSIPASLGTAVMQTINLSNNQLSGCFPRSLSVVCGRSVDFSGNSGLPGGGNFATFCQTPTASASTSTPNVTVGQTVSLSATGGTYYSWRGPSSYTANVANPSFVSSSTAQSGVYSVTVSNGSCTGNPTASVNITVNPCPSTTYNVTNTNDAGAGSLRQAMLDIAAFACPGPFTITTSVSGTINLASLLPDITKDVAFIGPGASNLTIRRNSSGNYRIFTIPNNNTVSFDGFTIADGFVELNSGGGIQNNGMLTLSNCILRNNHASDLGGGVHNGSGGSLTVTNCRFEGNSAAASAGGGISHAGSLLNITNSTFITNSAYNSEGGGLSVDDNSSNTTVTNCLFVSNSAVFGGGMAFRTPVTVINCTFTGNTGGGVDAYLGSGLFTNTTISFNKSNLSGAGISVDHYVPVTLKNCIVAGNTNLAGTTPNDIGTAGTFSASSYNVIGTGGSGGLTNGVNNNIVGVNALLAPLGNYGGTTQTHALLPGSPAINAGTSSGAPTTDQRGISRVGATDVGSFESRGFAMTLTSGNNQSATVGTAFANPLVVTLSSANSEPVAGGAVTFTGLGSGASINPVSVTASIAGTTASASVTANATSGAYSVTASANGATPNRTFNLTNTSTAPTITDFAASPNVVCVLGSPVTFTATVGNVTGSYSYTLTNGSSTTMGTTSNTSFSQSLTASGSGLQTFTLIVNTNSQTIRATTNVTVSSASISYVTQTGAGVQNGSSWANAYPGTMLQTAINSATSCGGQVWVAAGLYKPTTGSDRNASFSMRNNVTIYGGFPATGNPTFAQRGAVDPITGNPSSSTLSGEIGDLNSRTDNSLHVINNPASLSLDASAVLDGFVITAGYTPNDGAGMYNDGSGSGNRCNPTLRNCSFVNNQANEGGGIYANGSAGGQSNPQLTNCSFSQNTAQSGGGIYANGSDEGQSVPQLTNCDFISNTGSYAGGGLYLSRYNSLPKTLYLTNCRFLNNVGGTSSRGAGVQDNGSAISPVVVTGCIFENNSASEGGAFNSSELTQAQFIDCTFRRNSADFGGAVEIATPTSCTFLNCNFEANRAGAIHTVIGGRLQLTNCTFDGNSGRGGGAIETDALTTLTHCRFQSNTATSGGGGAISSTEALTMTQCSFQNNSASVTGGAIATSNLLWLTNCSFQNNSASFGGGAIEANAGTLLNCVLFNNGTPANALSGAFAARYSLFEQGMTGYTNGPGNLTTTVSPFISTTSAALNACALAINAADPATTSATVGNTDLAGNPRFFNALDMGAYEFQGNPGSLLLNNPSVSIGTIGVAFSQSFTASGGTSPYSFSLASGTLPTGLNLSAAGVLSGTSTQSGSFSITVRAIDANGCVGVGATYTLVVNPASPTIAGFAVSLSVVCSGNPVTFTATVGNVTGSYNYTLSNGNSTSIAGSTSSTAFSQTLTASGLGVQSFTLLVSNGGQPATAVTSLTVGQSGVTRLYVKANATGANTGLNWNDAFPDLNSALHYACIGSLTEIWIARGKYTPATGTFFLLPDVAIYGGFEGTETALSQRPPITLSNPSSTTLSGDVDGDNTLANNANVIINNTLRLTSTAILDGAIITGPRSGTQSAAVQNNSDGNGLVGTESSPVYRNLLFTGFTYDGTFAGSSGQFVQNVAVNGGITNPSFVNCVFRDNQGNGGNSGAIYNLSLANSQATVKPQFINCVIANHTGGAFMYNFGRALPQFINCSFLNLPNGLVNNYTTLPGIASEIQLTNSVLWNTGGASTFQNETVNSTVPVTISYSSLDQAITGYTSGPGNLTTTSSPYVSAGDLTLPTNSPAVNAGNPASITVVSAPYSATSLPTIDAATNPRIVGSRVDMGALEVQNPAAPTPTITGFAANSNAVCTGSPITFTATIGNVTGNYNYTLTNGTSTTTATTSNAALSQNLVASSASNQSFTLTVSSAGQSVSALTNVTINAFPVATLTNNGPISCTMTSVTLTASGGTSYTFTNSNGLVGIPGMSNTAVVTNAGSYSVSVASAGGCVSTTSTIVSSQTNVPTVSINPSSATLTCTNPVVSLSAVGNGTYRWNTGATTSSISATVGGPYSVTLTGVNGCTVSASANVVQDNSMPQVSISPNSATLSCATSSVSLSAIGNGTYRWSTGATTQVISVTSAGLYSVTLTGANGCIASTSISISNDANLPVASILAPNSLMLTCSTPVLNLTATGGGTYRWSSGETTSIVSVTTAGTYSVTVTSLNGCSSTTSASVSQDQTPPSLTISPASGTLTCTSPTISLSAVGVGTYRWSTGATSQTISVSITGPYSVSLTAANGCSASASTTISLDNTPPTVSITPSSATLTCASPLVSLSAVGTGSLRWNTGATTSVISATSAGTYSVTLTGVNGCTAMATAQVVQDNSMPTVSINPNSATLSCTTSSVSLSAVGSGTYRWNTGAITSSISVTAAGTYSVTLTSGTGCTATASASVVQDNTPPTISISPSTGTPTATTLTCTSPTVSLSAVGNGTYRWNTGAVNASISVSAAGIYSVTVTGANGCTATASTTVTYQNCAPTLANAIPNQSAIVGQAFSYTIPATTFTDAETPGNLTLSVIGLPAGLSFVAPNAITGTPSTTLGSPFSVTVIATDPGGLSVSTSFSLSVQPSQPSGFAITQVTLLNCDHLSYYARRIDFSTAYSGTNGQPISLSVVNELTATTNTGPYSLTVYTDNPEILVRARQQGTPGEAIYRFRWIDGCFNGPPIVLNSIPPHSVTLGQAFSYTIPANTFTDAETPNSLSLSVVGLPAGVSFVAPATIIGTPSTTVSPFYSVTVTATDPGGQSVSTIFPLSVEIPGGCANMYTLKAGDWGDTSVWSCGRVPLITDVVTLNHAVSLPAGYQGQALRIIYSGTGRLLFGTSSRLRLGGN